MADFILEIGTEELPHGFINGAIKQLSNKTQALFTDNGITYEHIHCYGTPRRHTVIFSGVSEKQAEREDIRKGPPLKAAFKDGILTKAGAGFIRSSGFDPSDISPTVLPALPEGKRVDDGLYLRKFNG